MKWWKLIIHMHRIPPKWSVCKHTHTQTQLRGRWRQRSFISEVLPLRPDGHRGEGLGKKKLDPCSNSWRTLRTRQTGPAERIDTPTPQAWLVPHIHHTLFTRCVHDTQTWCGCVSVWEWGKGEGIQGKKDIWAESCNLKLHLFTRRRKMKIVQSFSSV